MKKEILFSDENHKFIVIGRDEYKPENIIDSNQAIIIHDDFSIMIDPGGMESYGSISMEVMEYLNSHPLKYIFATHQDPDIASSLSLWLNMYDVKLYVSRLWLYFMPNFGGTKDTFIPIEDEGGKLDLGGGDYIEFIPAHFLHSPGNFSFYDSRSKTLFSGDIGAALLNNTAEQDFYVKDFDEHVKYMNYFHNRYFASNKYKNKWIESVKKLNINYIVPQHGSIFKNDNIDKFLNWFSSLNLSD